MKFWVKIKVLTRTALKFINYSSGSASCSMCIKHLRTKFFFTLFLILSLSRYELPIFYQYISRKFGLWWTFLLVSDSNIFLCGFESFFQSFYWLWYWCWLLCFNEYSFFSVTTLCQFWIEKSGINLKKVVFLHVKDQNNASE